MIVKIADNIISPIGMTTEENLNSILYGRSELRHYTGQFGLPEDFCGSLIDRETIGKEFAARFGNEESYSFFEKLCIISADASITKSGINPQNENVVFVISSTKGNVEHLAHDLKEESCYIGNSALKIAQFFGNKNTPIVASNACISGVCAQIAAIRQLLAGKYRTAIVIGADILSKFIISGFQSFKALSPDECKPYDNDRIGLNLGEAVGSMILQSTPDAAQGCWRYKSCSIHNDANHISGPSRTGEGSFRVLKDVLDGIDQSDLAFVSTHGTATAYNDEMESIAMHRAGLDDIPVCGLKGFYGHTLGAAGLIETILAMAALDKGIILPTRGYENQGTSYALNISSEARRSDKKTFIKILSGFGGSNAGIAYQKGGDK